MSAAHAALRLLAHRPAFELVHQEFEVFADLRGRGWARIQRTLDTPSAGAHWTLQLVEITDAGRDALQEAAAL